MTSLKRAHSVSLALQGGGALGALTWGVLDRLLDEPRLSFDGISGSSAGAMNAVAVAQGLAAGGRQAARNKLEELWRAIAGASPAIEMPFGDTRTASPPPSSLFLLGLLRFFSPYQFNPFDFNPLRSIVERLFDFEQLRRVRPVHLFIGATRVDTGALRLFRGAELTADHLLASACLPALQQAVMIDGAAYWDGGYAANPAIYPLVYDCASHDIVVVMLQPLVRKETPRTAEAIRRRLTEIQFNATFLREMRALALAQREVARGLFRSFGRLDRRLRSLYLHLIEADDLISKMDAAKSLNTSLPFLLRLKEEGQRRADQWLVDHGGKLGRQSSVDLGAMFG